jgi:hypothetical protein
VPKPVNAVFLRTGPQRLSNIPSSHKTRANAVIAGSVRTPRKYAVEIFYKTPGHEKYFSKLLCFRINVHTFFFPLKRMSFPKLPESHLPTAPKSEQILHIPQQQGKKLF